MAFAFLPNLSWLVLLLVLILVVVAYFLARFVIKPYLNLQFYAKQGLVTQYAPFLGPYVQNKKAVDKYGDYFYEEKQWIKKDPTVQAYATNVTDEVLLFLVDPEYIKGFYQKQLECYVKDLKTLGLLKTLIGNSINSCEGAEWVRQKRVLASIYNDEFLQQNFPMFQDISKKFFDELEKQPDLNNNVLIGTTGEIIGIICGKMTVNKEYEELLFNGKPIHACVEELFGRANDCQDKDIIRMFGAQNCWWSSEVKQIKKDMQAFREFLHQHVLKRVQEYTPTSYKDMMNLMIQKSKETGGEAFTTWNMVDQWIMFIAGALEPLIVPNTLYLLCQNPDAKKIIEEEVLKYGNRKLTYEEVDNMPMLDACLNESLRLLSTAGVNNRRVIKDHMLGSLKVKAGTLVNLSTPMAHFNPNFWANAEAFRLDRWYGTNRKIDTENWSWFPFSKSSRICMPVHQSYLDMKIMMIDFIRRFEFDLSKDFKLKLKVELIYIPVDPILFDLKLRKKN
jgi:cytochrome P450